MVPDLSGVSHLLTDYGGLEDSISYYKQDENGPYGPISIRAALSNSSNVST